MQQCLNVFKMLGDETRLRLAVLLAVKGETCVCLLADALDIPEYNVSRHLSKMKLAGMVTAVRKGKWMHYSLAEPRNVLEKSIYRCLKTCFLDNLTSRADIEMLSRSTCSTKVS